jgi:DMSO/TMAO reductase YedYZ molybdopterin-dependent catalytic subunit
MTSARPTDTGRELPPWATWATWALAGVAAAAAGIAASELAAGLLPGFPSLVIAVGTQVIALQPPGAKDLMVGLFGTNDKLALNIFIVVVALVVAAGVGLLARRHGGAATLAIVGFGVVGFAAAAAESEVTVSVALASALLAAGVAYAALSALTTLARLDDQPPQRGSTARTAAGAAQGTAWWTRRRFLIGSGGLIGAAAIGGGIGRSLLNGQHPAEAPGGAAETIPAHQTVPALAADQSLDAPGLSPLVTPAASFYRTDTELLIPQVDASTWQLSVTGMIDHPLTFTYAQLLAMPLFDQYVTIACVSNEVGGDLVGNALWTGVHLRSVLAMAGVQTGATQIVGKATDGFTVGFPTSWAMDLSRDPMIAVGMNGAPLPPVHGYPARLIVPGLYGYVSATKWLTEINLTTREAFDGYWVPLGWAKDGPILTQSRIDHPQDGSHLAVGPVVIDGVGWAPDRGIQGVEISIDGGAWQQAQLARAISKATWVQWMLTWQASAGQHVIEVRATDGTGTVQTSDSTPPAPDGARGHMRIAVTVS